MVLLCKWKCFYITGSLFHVPLHSIVNNSPFSLEIYSAIISKYIQFGDMWIATLTECKLWTIKIQNVSDGLLFNSPHLFFSFFLSFMDSRRPSHWEKHGSTLCCARILWRSLSCPLAYGSRRCLCSQSGICLSSSWPSWWFPRLSTHCWEMSCNRWSPRAGMNHIRFLFWWWTRCCRGPLSPC